jgi:thiamine transporter
MVTMSGSISAARRPLWRRGGELAASFNPGTWGVQAIAETAVARGLAAALGQLRLFTMPQGGSVTLEMLPLLFLALRRGVGPAVVAGGLYGFLQLLLPGAVIFHPAQVALDYPLAFAAVGSAGLIRATTMPRMIAAVSLGCAGRFVLHFLSGLIFFASYAPEWAGPWLWSVVYNVSYLVPQAVISAIVLWPLLKAYDAAFPARAGTPGGPPGAAAGGPAAKDAGRPPEAGGTPRGGGSGA